MIKQSYTVGGKTIHTYIPKSVDVHNLENLYDCCNELFSEWEDCFYSKHEVKDLKKDTSNKFLKKGWNNESL